MKSFFGRGGFSLLEATVALVLSAVLIQAGWWVFGSFLKAGTRLGTLAEGLETVRTVAWILDEEFSESLSGRDWLPGDGDTLALRAFRGLATILGPGAQGALPVCYRGVRSPNPEKDSVLFLVAGGQWTTHALTSRTRGDPGCFGGGQGWEESWTVEPAPASPLFGRVFERGSYHLTQMALRYRRGDGGRQPLTPLRIVDGRLDSEPGAGGGLHWEIVLGGPSVGVDSASWAGRAR